MSEVETGSLANRGRVAFKLGALVLLGTTVLFYITGCLCGMRRLSDDCLVTTVHTVEIAEHNDTIAEFVGHFVIVSDDLHVQFP